MCVAYHQMYSTIKGILRSPLDGDKVNEISQLILAAEGRIVKAIDYDFNFPLPHAYLKHYVDVFYSTSPSVFNFSSAVLNDLIGTKLPLIFHGRTIALVSLLLGSNYLQVMTIDNPKILQDTERWLELRKLPPSLLLEEVNYHLNTSDEEYLALPWFKRIHPDLTLDEIKGNFLSNLIDALSYANEVYESHLTTLESKP